MKPIQFPEANVVYGAEQEQYKPLHACRHADIYGTVVTCWTFSLWDRIKIAFGGKVWLSQLTFKNPLQPLFLSTIKAEHIAKSEDAPTNNNE